MIAVWFDIDGTLVDTGGSGGEAFKQTLRNHYDLDDPMEYIGFAGATDAGLLHDVMQRNQRSFPEDQGHSFYQALLPAYEASFSATPPKALAGTKELLEQLAGDERCVLGLLTGNAELLAYTKLRHVALDHFFDHGGFGDQHPDRNHLAHLAKEEATKKFGPLTRSVVIGDTPRDVEAAHAVGATAIAVATGGFTAEQLTATNAHHVLADLTDTEATMQHDPVVATRSPHCPGEHRQP